VPATRLQEAEIRVESDMQAEASQAAAAETETLKASILIRETESNYRCHKPFLLLSALNQM
jgi:hypothetical protein